MAENGFKSFINIFTRLLTYGAFSCIDNIFIRASQSMLDNTNAVVLQTHFTDHCSPIMSMPKLNNFKQECFVLKSINYKL